MNKPTSPDSLSTTRQRLADRGTKLIDLQFIDWWGQAKTITVPVAKLETIANKGYVFDGSAIDGFARTIESDLILMPDFETLRPWPWSLNQAERVFGKILTPDLKPFAGDSRSVLANLEERLKSLSVELKISCELEFYLLKDNQPIDTHGYFDWSSDLSSQVREDMALALEALGIPIDSLHHESSPGQHEIVLSAQTPLKLADALLDVKSALKAIALKYDLTCTFMPKPFTHLSGSGLHLHLSAYQPDNTPLFYQMDAPLQLSSAALRFKDVLLNHMRGIQLFLAPTVNSYKRLLGGGEAPYNHSFGRGVPSALLRVAEHHQGTLELRSADPSCNPYFVFALLLAILEESILAPSASSILPETLLPQNMNEAIDNAKQEEKFLRTVFGDWLLKKYLSAKEKENMTFLSTVTDWELNRYL
jgi:glutamine synthetase